MVASCDLGGSVADLAADVSLVENLLSQETETLHLLLVNQHLLLPALIIDSHTHTNTLIDINNYITAHYDLSELG